MRALPLPPMTSDAAVNAAGRALGAEGMAAYLHELDRDVDVVLAWGADEACAAFAAWLEMRGAKLTGPAIDAALELLGTLPTRELRHWLALRVLVFCPASLLFKVKPLFEARGAGVLPLATAVRDVALARDFDAKDECLAWCGAVGVLDEAKKESSASGATPKKKGSAKKSSGDAAPIAKKVIAEWDAGKPKSRELLDDLAAASAGRVWLAWLARAAPSKSLRSECYVRLERMASEAPNLRDALDVELATIAKKDPKSPLASDLGGHLEEAMAHARAMKVAAVRALAGDGAVLVRFDGGKVPVAALLTAKEAIGARGATVALEANARVTVVHPVHLTAPSLAAFVSLLAQHKLLQPFDQINRVTYRVPQNHRGLESFDLPVPRPRLAGPMWERGWDPIFDDDDWDAVAWQSEKVFPHFGLHATWTHETTMRGGIEPHYESPHEIEGESVAFLRNGASILLGEVPLVAFSEVVRELLPGGRPPRVSAVVSKMDESGRAPATEPGDGEDDVEEAPLPKPKGKVSSVDRLSDVIERVMRSPEHRADASRAIEKMGEQAVRAITLVGSAKARDDAALAAGLGVKVADAQALASRLEQTLRSVVYD